MHNNWLSFTLPDLSREELYKNVQLVNIPFKPMSHSDLHMTMMYFGKIIHDRTKYNIMVNIMKQIETKKTFKFTFKCYSYFPYTKKNHIVAIYDTTPDCYEYVKTVRSTLKKAGIVDPDESFIPHVTMGRIIGKSVYDNTHLSHLTPLPDFEVSTSYMCGELYKYMDKEFSL